MCGIAGFLGPISEAEKPIIISRIEQANAVQKHRGPNHQAFTIYPIKSASNQSVVFLHQRLSIIDLSTGANQPFEDDDYSLVFNGEIYNYLELRKELSSEGIQFATTSDTEVLFKGLRNWGVERTLKKCNGMWAFAWLNKNSGELTLARDRFGIKPLYYRRIGKTFVFASEIKTVLAMEPTPVTLNPVVVSRYLVQAVLEGDPVQTFFQEIVKVPPGTFATMTSGDTEPEFQRFYNLVPDAELRGLSLEEASSELKKRLERAVEIRLRADVPVGVLLSGGLDSSVLAALTMRQNSKPVELLSFVSNDPESDESHFSDSMANHLGVHTRKVEIEFEKEDPIAGLARATWQNDQPIQSFSAYAHLLLMEKAKKLGVTVLLSGQGADESFCGYRKYWPFYLQTLLRRGRLLDFAVNGAGLMQNSELFSGVSYSEFSRYLPGRSRRTPLMEGVADFLNLGLEAGESVEGRQIRDVLSLSVPSLLHYEDRMSMANAREIRLPFLDYTVVELGISLPTEFKLQSGWTKFILRKAFEDSLPREIAWRRDKKGFTNPQSKWMGGSLVAAVKECIGPGSLMEKFGISDGRSALAYYDQVLLKQGRADERLVFRMLALEIFLSSYRRFLEPSAATA